MPSPLDLTASDPWSTATSFGDLLVLNEAFIRGELTWTLDHGGPLMPESDELVSDLLALNRAGVFTTCSQPGRRAAAASQRAYVEGLASGSLVQRIEQALLHTSLVVVRPCTGATTMAITTQDGGPCTYAGRGAQWPGRELLMEGTRLPDDVWEGLCPFEVFDPVWGRRRYLWDQLRSAVSPQRTIGD